MTLPAARTPRARALRHVASLSSGAPVDPALRVTLNFHPDRDVRGTPILRAPAEDGVYRSQFVTGTGNGGLTAHPGGDRWRWESRIFAGAYDAAPAHERPVYGALNFRRKPAGGAPRFGSAHIRLTAGALARDGHLDPRIVGDAARGGLHDPQALKRVWHYVARFGTPPDDTAGTAPADGAGSCPSTSSA